MGLKDRLLEVIEGYKSQLGYMDPGDRQREIDRVEALAERLKRADVLETEIRKRRVVHREPPVDA